LECKSIYLNNVSIDFKRKLVSSFFESCEETRNFIDVPGEENFLLDRKAKIDEEFS